MAGIRLEGNTSGNVAEITDNQLHIRTEVNTSAYPERVGGFKHYGANDEGDLTGVVRLRSPEVDVDYRERSSVDVILDEEVHNYTAQNTGKTSYANTTMAATWTAGQFTTNSGSIITTTTGLVYQSRAFFPSIGTQTLSIDMELAFSAQPTTNTIIDFGGFVPGAANPYTPVDGAFFRLNSAGLQGIISHNGTETSTGVFPLSGGTGTWAYTNNKRYQFIVYLGGVEAQFWVNDGTGAVLMGSTPLPAGQGRIIMGASVPWAIRHAIVGGAAGGVIQALLGAVNVRVGGAPLATFPSTQGNRLYGSYQGMSGGTMGSLATYPNNTNPTAAAPSNTALTANLPAGLGGQGNVIAAAAAATDGIWASYQVPAATVNMPGRRLVLRGVRLDAVNLGAAVATTATTVQFSLAFGHTAANLATAEAATTKAPRRIPIGFMTWAVGAAIGAQPQNGAIFLDLGDAPVFVNPGEFVALVGKFVVGTATASQTIQFTWTPVYGWE
jgi:hypothetical protein